MVRGTRKIVGFPWIFPEFLHTSRYSGVGRYVVTVRGVDKDEYLMRGLLRCENEI